MLHKRGPKILIFLGTVLVIAGAMAWYTCFLKPQPLWSHSEEHLKKLDTVSLDHHAEILEDYFLYERLGESLHYELKHSLMYNSKKAPSDITEAYQNALEQTFKGKVRPPEAMIILANGGLYEKFNRFFIESLLERNIKQGRIHWSLNFIPEQQLNLNYQNHLENSQVLEWKPQTDWVSKLKKNHRKDVGQFSDKLYNLTIPGNGQVFQYLAGAIHYELDLNQINSDTSSLGTLTFRKYYRVDEGNPFRQNFESSGFHLEHIRLKSEINPPIITVDLVENFTLDRLTPELKHLQLYFAGVQEKTKEEASGLGQKNKLTLVGELLSADHNNILFEMNLTSLSFDIKKGLVSHLNEEQTKFNIKLLPEEIDLKQSRLFKQQVRNKVLREHQRDLLKSVKANLLSKHLMRGANL